MNNKIIALAVAGVLAAPMAAQAAPKVYGIGQVELQSTDSSSTTASLNVTETQDNKFGRFGIKGSEDLGGGLKALYTFEFGMDTTGDNFDSSTGKGGAVDTLFKRETSIGMKIGKAHEIRMGNIKSPYKYTAGVKYDSFVATSLQAREGSENTAGNIGGAMSAGAYGQGGFLADSISYKGKFKPVTVWFSYSPDETDKSASGAAGAKNGVAGAVTALAVSAKVGAFHFGAATITKDSCDSSAANALCANDVSEVKSDKIFGSWSMGQHTVRAQAESRTITAGAAGSTGVDTDFLYLNYQFKMGKHLVDVALGEADDGTTATNKDVSWSRLAYAYNFSKKTRVFAGIVSRDLDGTGTDTDVTSIGMTVKF